MNQDNDLYLQTCSRLINTIYNIGWLIRHFRNRPRPMPKILVKRPNRFRPPAVLRRPHFSPEIRRREFFVERRRRQKPERPSTAEADAEPQATPGRLRRRYFSRLQRTAELKILQNFFIKKNFHPKPNKKQTDFCLTQIVFVVRRFAHLTQRKRWHLREALFLQRRQIFQQH